MDGELLVTFALLPVVWAAILAPGYLVLRTWFDRLVAMHFSFPASLVLVHTSSLLLQLLGFAISGVTVTSTLVLIFALALTTSRKRTRPLWKLVSSEARGVVSDLSLRLRSMDRASWITAALVLLMIAVVSVDFARDPLVRSDNTFRWGNLANRLYALQTLDFYPPRTAADFAVYNMPDGIGPQLAIMYWWSFVVTGGDAPIHALGFIQLQAIWLVVMIAALSELVGGRGSYRWGAILACCASTPLSTISCGAESGLLAIGTAGAVYCLLKLDATDEPGWAFLAVITAAVAALAREYGLATIALTLCVLLVKRRPARELAAATALAALLAGTWYLRTWVRSGNPFLILELGGLFPGIAVHTHYLKRCAEAHAITAMSLSELSRFAFWLVWGAPIAWLIGAPVAIRRALPIPLSFAVAWVLIWLKATTYSAGGYGFALRVASPAIAILTAFAACWVSTARSVVLRSAGAVLVAVLFLKTGTDLLAGPGARAFRVPLSSFFRPATRAAWPFAEELATEIRTRGGRVLSSNGHLAPAMRAYGIDLAPIWSPEFTFLFDPSVAATEVIEKLRERNVFFYIPLEWTEFTNAERARTLTEAFSGWRSLSDAEPPLLAAE